MKFAIIAAGEGSRLNQEGIAVPKPLVRLQGEPMIDRLLRIFAKNEAEEVVVVVNTLRPEVERHLRDLQEHGWGEHLRIVVQTTPSSLHSFHALSPYLRESPFCLTTVDTVFREDEFSHYLDLFRHSEAEGFMAVTDFVDDEKPLYVGTDPEMNITGFFDEPAGCRYVSGGIYCLHPDVLSILDECVEQGVQRMRNFQRRLVAKGIPLRAYAFSRILDVDHIGDIEKAEKFLAHAE